MHGKSLSTSCLLRQQSALDCLHSWSEHSEMCLPMRLAKQVKHIRAERLSQSRKLDVLGDRVTFGYGPVARLTFQQPTLFLSMRLRHRRMLARQLPLKPRVFSIDLIPRWSTRFDGCGVASVISGQRWN
jgi:hypothetical protein